MIDPTDCARCGHALNLHEQDDETGTERVIAGCCKGTCACAAYLSEAERIFLGKSVPTGADMDRTREIMALDAPPPPPNPTPESLAALIEAAHPDVARLVRRQADPLATAAERSMGAALSALWFGVHFELPPGWLLHLGSGR